MRVEIEGSVCAWEFGTPFSHGRRVVVSMLGLADLSLVGWVQRDQIGRRALMQLIQRDLLERWYAGNARDWLRLERIVAEQR